MLLPFTQEAPLTLGGDTQILPDSYHGNGYVFDVVSKSPGQRILKG